MAGEPVPGWSGADGRECARQVVGRMMEELDLDGASRLQVARALTREEFQARRLGRMLRVLYHDGPYFAVTDCRPELASWRHEPAPDDYWRGLEGIERARAATIRMLAEIGLAEVAERGAGYPGGLRAAAQVTSSVFEWCGLDRMLEIVYAGSVAGALRAVVPGIPFWRHQPFPKPKGYWEGLEGVEHAQAATRQLIGEHGWAGLDAEEVAVRLTHKIFMRYGLVRMLEAVYEGRTYDALADIYPGLHPWQMSKVPQTYWQGVQGRKHARAATRWLIERLGLIGVPPVEVARQLGSEAFEANGLRGMMAHVYANSPFAALQHVFPKLRPWLVDMPAPAGYWVGEAGRKHAHEAMRWMFGEMGPRDATPTEIAGAVDRAVFARMGLSGMLGAVYHSSPYAALSDLFPALHPWQMRGGVPMGYWQGEQGREHAREATRWLLEQHGLEDEDPAGIAAVIEPETFADVGLIGMLSIVYKGNPYAALADLFPQLPPWEPRRQLPRGYLQAEEEDGHDPGAQVSHGARQLPHGYWRGEEGRKHAHEAMRWMLGEMGLRDATPTAIAGAVDRAVFARMGLGSMLAALYGYSPYKALKDVFPTLCAWQMRGGVPQGYWQGEQGREHAREATRWLLKQHGLENEDPAVIVGVIKQAMFYRAGLSGMLIHVYMGSCYAALADIFPQLPPREPRPDMPHGYWQGEQGREHARQATRRMLASLDLDGADPADIAAVVDKKVFVQHGLGSPLRLVYGLSAWRALADLFPDLRPWQMGVHAPQGCWHGEEGRRNGREATLHMLARLGLKDADPAEIARVVDAGVFERAGLGVMLMQVYGNSPYQALKDQYPDLRPWQMGTAPRDCWRGEDARAHAREATLRLLDKLGIEARPGDKGLRTVTKATFRDNNLAGMLSVVYGNSPYDALADAVPGLRPWQVNKAPRSYWQGEQGREHAREATRQLLAERRIAPGTAPGTADPETASKRIVRSAFIEAGLRGMLSCVYGGSVNAAMTDVNSGSSSD